MDLGARTSVPRFDGKSCDVLKSLDSNGIRPPSRLVIEVICSMYHKEKPEVPSHKSRVSFHEELVRT